MSMTNISLGDHREIALKLLEELDVLLKKDDEESSKTAKTVCESIACHLKDGGANLSKCENCGLYKWGRQRKNDMWRDVIHDPNRCPKMRNMSEGMFNIRESFGTLGTLGKKTQTRSFPDMSILRRDKEI